MFLDKLTPKIKFKILIIYNISFLPEMVKRTSTMVATLKDAKRIVRKPKKPRTSTIDETIATASQGFKQKKKATKTRTMVQTIKDAEAPKAQKKPRKAKKPVKTKKVAKKGTQKKGGKKSKK